MNGISIRDFLATIEKEHHNSILLVSYLVWKYGESNGFHHYIEIDSESYTKFVGMCNRNEVFLSKFENKENQSEFLILRELKGTMN